MRVTVEDAVYNLVERREMMQTWVSYGMKKKITSYFVSSIS